MRLVEKSDQGARTVNRGLFLGQQRRNARRIQVEPALMRRRPRYQRVLLFHRPPGPADAAREHRRVGEQEIVDVQRIAQNRPGPCGDLRQPWRGRFVPAAFRQPGHRDALVAGRAERQLGSRHHVHRIRAIEDGKIVDAFPLRAEQPTRGALRGGMREAAADVVEHDAGKHAPAVELALHVVLHPLRPVGQPAESRVVRKCRIEIMRCGLDAKNHVVGLTADRLDQRLMVHRLIGEVAHRQLLATRRQRDVHGADDAVVPIDQRRRCTERAAALVLRPRGAPLR